MREVGIQELREIQIQILDIVTSFCEQHNIQYWLDSGTLLGAIRHKGYIPWDDDIDIGMLREDFDKFMNLFNQYNSKYKFHCVENDADFFTAFGKVIDTDTILQEGDFILGINIDIFVYDNAPKRPLLQNIMFLKRDIYDHLEMYFLGVGINKGNYICRFVKNGIYWILKPLKYFVHKGFFAKKISNNSKRYSTIETECVGNFTSVTKAVCSKEVFSSFIEGEFEGKMYKIPVGYDKWLSTFYGDYMQLPPIEKRKSNHDFKAWVK